MGYFCSNDSAKIDFKEQMFSDVISRSMFRKRWRHTRLYQNSYMWYVIRFILKPWKGLTMIDFSCFSSLHIEMASWHLSIIRRYKWPRLNRAGASSSQSDGSFIHGITITLHWRPGVWCHWQRGRLFNCLFGTTTKETLKTRYIERINRWAMDSLTNGQ